MNRVVSPQEVARFRQLVHARTGMALSDTRIAELRRALGRVASDLDMPVDDLVGTLSDRAPATDLVDALVCALNVGETHFFRGAAQMDFLQRRILPDLVERRRMERRLRIWIAGCSTGEEAYTVAILLRNAMPSAGWDIQLLATDINGRALEFARRGLYRKWSFRGDVGSADSPHLIRTDDGFEVVPQIRQMVTFARMNLSGDQYPSADTAPDAMDLILCRNVLIYFAEDDARAAVRRLGEALAVGGWLMLGPVESSLGGFEGLEAEGRGSGVYRRPGGHGGRDHHPPYSPAPVTQIAPPPRPVPERRSSPIPPPETSATTADAAALDLWRSGRAEEALDRLASEAEARPLTAPLHHLMGLILLEEQRAGEALAAFRRSNYADPSFAPAYVGQAIAFTARGSPKRAWVALDNAVHAVSELEPDAIIPETDGLRPVDVLALVAVHRELLGSDVQDARRG